jgi:rubrerythrin
MIQPRVILIMVSLQEQPLRIYQTPGVVLSVVQQKICLNQKINNGGFMKSIEIALKMETDAVKFYTEASQKVFHPAGKKMFLTIAEDEKNHIKMIEEVLKGLELTIREANPIKTVKTIFEEMKDQMMERLKAEEDELEAFRIAMEMEKEGIEFYKKVKDEVNTEKEKKLFERLIYEEEQHYKIFSETYTFLKDTGNWFMLKELSIVEG